MKEYEIFLKNLAEMLKSFGKVVEEIGEKVNEFAKLQEKPKPEEKVQAEPVPKLEAKPAEEKVEKEEALPKEKAVSATAAVLNLIQKSKEGVSVSTIKEKTGFDSRKINSIVYRLKKRGQIKSEKKGVYTKS